MRFDVNPFCRDKQFPNFVVFRILLAILVFWLLWLISSCVSPTPSILSTKISSTITPAIEIEITAWASVSHGILMKSDNCLLLKSSDYKDVDFTLVWPSDFIVEIGGNSVKVNSGNITGEKKEVVLIFGDNVTFGGGSVNQLSEDLKKTVPANCNAPYWVVGSIVNH